MMKKEVTISIAPKEGKISVNWSFNILSTKKDGGVYICYIPVFNMFFSAIDEQSIEKKSKVMTGLYFDRFFIHGDKKNSIKNLTVDLRKKGLIPTKYDYSMPKLLKNNIVKTSFLNKVDSKIPDGFYAENTRSVNHEMEVFA
jgi:hypothetical protein